MADMDDDEVLAFETFAYERGAGDPAADGTLPEAISLQLNEVTADPDELVRAVQQQHPIQRRLGRHVTVSLIDTAGGKTESAIDFEARSVVLFNYSETWFQFDDDTWIPPGAYGTVLRLVPPVGRARLQVAVPPGVSQGSAAGKYCFAVFCEDILPPTPGLLLGSLV